MPQDLETIWKKLGLHHLQARKLGTIGLTPAKAMGTLPRELKKSYGLTDSLIQKLRAVLVTDAGKEVIEQTKGEDFEKSEDMSLEQTPSDEHTSTGGKGERVTGTAKKKATKRAKKKAKAKKKKARATRETKKRKALEVPDVSGLSAKDKLRLIQSSLDQDYLDAGLIGIASELKSLDLGYISTGFLALDMQLGDGNTPGGWPRGKYSVIYGQSQSCKSTLCLHTIAKDQAEDPTSIWVWINAENSFDKDWATKIGVDITRVIVIEPLTMEEQIDRAREAITTGAITGVVVDSAGVWMPWQEGKRKRDDLTYTKSVSEDTMAILARTIGKFIRVTTALFARTKCTCLIISHEYASMEQYVPAQLKGGNALRYAGHVRVYTSRRKGDKNKTETITMSDGRSKEVYVGFEMGAKVDKTRQGPTEGHQVFIPFVYGLGLSEKDSIIEIALGKGIIQKNGNYYWHESFRGRTETQILGKDKTIAFIKEHDDVFSAVLESVGAAFAQTENEEIAAEGPDYREEPE